MSCIASRCAWSRSAAWRQGSAAPGGWCSRRRGSGCRGAKTVQPTELRRWSSEPGIRWHGRTPDVSEVWRTHHVAMLLTWYREGVPRSLIEAAASGRPIVTTDSPGCRDLVRDHQEGILVPLRDIEAA